MSQLRNRFDEMYSFELCDELLKAAHINNHRDGKLIVQAMFEKFPYEDKDSITSIIIDGTDSYESFYAGMIMHYNYLSNNFKILRATHRSVE